MLLQRFYDGDVVPVDSSEVWRLLEEAWDSPPNEFHFCRVTRGADEGDLYAVPRGDPIDALMFNHSGAAIYHLMFDLAVAGDMTVMPPDVGPFIVRPGQAEHLPVELRNDAVLVRSGEDLVRAITEA